MSALCTVVRDGKTFAPLAALRESDRNARRIPDDAVAAVRASIAAFGWRQPIVVDADGEIIVGHTRFRAAQQLGTEEVWIELAADLSPEQVRAYRIADNRTAEFSDWDTDLLGRELDELSSLPDASDIPGFSDDEITALTASVRQDDETAPNGDSDDDAPPNVLLIDGQRIDPVKHPRGQRRLVALSWPGGKARYLDHIRALLPTDIKCFIDAFGGGGSVTMNMGPYRVQIYNDLYDDLVHFFRLLRERPGELQRALELTPCARTEFVASLAKLSAMHAGTETVDDIERGRLFATVVNQSVFGNREAWQTPGATTCNAKKQVHRWSPKSVAEFAARWQQINIEKTDAVELIKNYADSPDAFFFCDPPYLHSVRRDNSLNLYRGGEMMDEQHEEMGAALNRITGRALVCSYRSQLYDRIFDGWRRADLRVWSSMRSNYGTESFYMNY